MEDLTQTVGMGQSEIHSTPEPEPKKNTTLILITTLSVIGLIILAIVSVTLNHSYEKRIAMMENGTWPGQNITANLTQAYTAGIITTLIQVINTTNDCQITSVKYGNQSRELVDVACVRKLLSDQNITLK